MDKLFIKIKYSQKQPYMIILAAILLALPLMMLTHPVYAYAASSGYGSWVQNSGSSPYGTFNGIVNNNTLADPSSNTIDTLLGSLIYSIAKGVRMLLEAADLNIESVVLGRVANSSLTDNHYAFELVKGNTYGVLGSTIYVLLRGIVWVLVALYFVTAIAKQGFSVSAKKKDDYKEMMLNVFLLVAFLILWPQIADAIIYLRDVVLQAEVKSLYGSNAKFDIAGEFANNYNNNGKNTINALMFLAVQVVSVALGFLYVSVAITQTIIFMSMPLIVILSVKDKSLLTSAVRTFVGNLLIPIVDMMVLFIPLQISGGTPDAATYLTTLIACLCVLPARNMIRQLFGIGGAGGAEALGLGAGMMALGAAAKGMNKAKDSAGSIGEMLKQKKKDKDKANEEAELADIEDKYKSPSNELGKKSDALTDDLDTTSDSFGAKDDSESDDTLGGLVADNRAYGRSKSSTSASNSSMADGVKDSKSGKDADKVSDGIDSKNKPNGNSKGYSDKIEGEPTGNDGDDDKIDLSTSDDASDADNEPDSADIEHADLDDLDVTRAGGADNDGKSSAPGKSTGSLSNTGSSADVHAGNAKITGKSTDNSTSVDGKSDLTSGKADPSIADSSIDDLAIDRKEQIKDLPDVSEDGGSVDTTKTGGKDKRQTMSDVSDVDVSSSIENGADSTPDGASGISENEGITDTNKAGGKDKILSMSDISGTAHTASSNGAVSGNGISTSPDSTGISDPRRANLRAMDMANDEINAIGVENNALQSELNSEKATQQANNAMAKKDIADIDRAIASEKLDLAKTEGDTTLDKEDKYMKMNATNENIARLQQKKADIQTGLAESNAESNAKQADISSKIASNNVRMSSAKADLANAKLAEQDFAAADKAMGGSGQSFGSTAQLDAARRGDAMQQEMNEVKKKHATLENFDSPEYANILSHREKAEFYKKRSSNAHFAKQVAAKVGKGTAVAGGAALGGLIVGGGSIMLGGRATATGALIGGMAGSSAAGKIVDMAPVAASTGGAAIRTTSGIAGRVAGSINGVSASVGGPTVQSVSSRVASSRPVQAVSDKVSAGTAHISGAVGGVADKAAVSIGEVQRQVRQKASESNVAGKVIYATGAGVASTVAQAGKAGGAAITNGVASAGKAVKDKAAKTISQPFTDNFKKGEATFAAPGTGKIAQPTGNSAVESSVIADTYANSDPDKTVSVQVMNGSGERAPASMPRTAMGVSKNGQRVSANGASSKLVVNGSSYGKPTYSNPYLKEPAASNGGQKDWIRDVNPDGTKVEVRFASGKPSPTPASGSTPESIPDSAPTAPKPDNAPGGNSVKAVIENAIKGAGMNGLTYDKVMEEVKGSVQVRAKALAEHGKSLSRDEAVSIMSKNLSQLLGKSSMFDLDDAQLKDFASKLYDEQ